MHEKIERTNYTFKYQSVLSVVLVILSLVVILLCYDILFLRVTPICRLIPQPEIITALPTIWAELLMAVLGLALLYLVHKIGQRICIYEGTAILLPDAIELHLRYSRRNFSIDEIMDIQFRFMYQRWSPNYYRFSITTPANSFWGGYRIMQAETDGHGEDESSTLYQFYRAAKKHWESKKAGY